MVPPLESQIKRLETDLSSELGQARSYHSDLIENLKELNHEYEEQIPESPSIPLVVGTYSKRWSKIMRKKTPEIKLIALSLACQAENESKKDLILEIQEASKELSAIKKLTVKFLKNYESSIEKIGSAAGTTYYPVHPGDTGALAFKTLPSDVLKDWQLDNPPEIIDPVMELIAEDVTDPNFYINSKSGYDYLEALILHENTHAYIKSKLGGDLGYKSIDEAAAQAVSGLISGEIDYARLETRVEHYRDNSRSYSRQELQFWREVFIRYAEKFETKPQKTYNIRKAAVKACRTRRKRQLTPEMFYKTPFIEKLTLTEMVLGRDVDELQQLWETVGHLEEAEKKCFHSLVILDILSEEVMEDQIQQVDNQIKSGFLRGIKNLIPNSESQEKYLAGIAGKTDSEEEERERFLFDIQKLEKSIEELKSILNTGELNKNEKRALETFIENLEKVIELYSQENKVATKYNQKFTEKYDEDAEKIGEWIRERTGNPKQTDSVRLGKNIETNLERIVEDYELVINTGLDYTQQMLDLMEEIYQEEEQLEEIFRKHKDRKDYQNIEFLERKTKELFKILEDSEERLEESKDEIEQAKLV